MFVRAASLVCVLALAAVLVPSTTDAATTVRITMDRGTFFDIELNDNTPLHRDNFLQYVNAGLYTNSIFHRSETHSLYSVLQGGGFTLPVDHAYFLDIIPTYAPVAYEGNLGWSNTIGTIGAARSTDPNSATSQWYINMTDNSAVFDDAPGTPGYTVFGRIVAGWDVAQELFSQNAWDFSQLVDPAFGWLPLESNYDGTYWPYDSDFLTIASAQVLPEPATMALLAVGGLALLRRRGRK